MFWIIVGILAAMMLFGVVALYAVARATLDGGAADPIKLRD
jgi:hypothetical protein